MPSLIHHSRAPSSSSAASPLPPPTKRRTPSDASTSTIGVAPQSGSSLSPASTLPTSNDETSPPASRANSRPSSRKSSFNSTGAAKPDLANGQAQGGQRFTLKDLLASGGPKLARRTSQSSRKSDTSSDHNDRPRRPPSTVGGESTTSLLKKYGVCEKIAIGRGATSVVRLAHKWDRSEEKLYAVKEFRKRRKNETEKEYIKKLTAEFCISSTLHHINIVETVDLVQDEAHHWCEVMEYCPGGDLYAAIKKGQMSTSEIECCFKQLLSGVQYLHSQGVAHRDIKPENLFFDTVGHLKIGDYGASTVYRLPWEATVHMSTGLCGSEPYIAPEQFLRKPYDARLVDIWAVGIVYYCLLFQELPWRVAQTSDALFASYQQACAAQPFKVHAAMTFPPTINNIEPREARPLLRRILEPDPKLRANIDEIMDNAWMRSIEVCTLVTRPNHIHSNIKAALKQQVTPLSGDRD
ncbi:kinase-like protein [Clavulina sp. PMI_390]|nr:kinase-like protein [Clavulina sp. PMI_390]